MPSHTVYHTVYLLTPLSSPMKSSYIGYTNDMPKRIRQHNRKLVGGAKKTKRHQDWRVVCVVRGFKTHQEGLQFEWMWQNPLKSVKSRKIIRANVVGGARGSVRRKVREISWLMEIWSKFRPRSKLSLHVGPGFAKSTLWQEERMPRDGVWIGSLEDVDYT